MTMTSNPLRTVFISCAFGLATQACSLLGTQSQIVTAPDGVRTFTVIHEVGGTPMACAAFGLVDPVHGTLAGILGANEPVWIVTDDGRHLSVVWPAGFSVQFEPNVSLYNEGGRVVGRAGDPIELSQTRWDSATGTYENPYLAQGLVFDSCYPFVK
jgi:hypothetical protein